MDLDEYAKKRNFLSTGEPADFPVSEDDKVKDLNLELSFVVQKHFATHLHYDFRLELDGALKSWAVPKGPSLNPVEKRLAVMVEDHPLEYKDFQGAISEGNYGAGEVLIWDKGTYNALGANEKNRSMEIIRDGMVKGHISFILKGNKLKGEFSLIRLKKSDPRNWLLVKKRDEFADSNDILI
jgi:DNA ligase D-like protein (predicted 3'-phosphoesterase)